MDLSDTRTLRELLERHGVAARKGLGQHFLISKGVVQRVVSRVVGFGGVLEIGPGPGVLTSTLSKVAEVVVALEVDPRMIEILAESAPQAEVVQGDALEVDLSLFLERLPRPRAVVSNLPYYITGPLLTRIADAKRHYDRAVLMMQKEVGVRVVAPPGDSDRGSLSVFLQAQFDIAKVVDVPPGAFWPAPKVESIVLEFVPRGNALSPQHEAEVLQWVRGAFRQPRKTLANNLAAMGHSRESVAHALESAGLDPRCRPSDPDFDQWRQLWEGLS